MTKKSLAYFPECFACHAPITIETSRPLALKRWWNEEKETWERAQYRICKMQDACNDPSAWAAATARFAKTQSPTAEDLFDTAKALITTQDADDIATVLRYFARIKSKTGTCPVCGAAIGTACVRTCLLNRIPRLLKLVQPAPLP